MKVRVVLLLSFMIGCAFPQFAQGIAGGVPDSDTSRLAEPKPLHIVDINFEMERTKKKLSKMIRELEGKAEFEILDSLVDMQMAFMKIESEEFKQFNPYKLSKYFLENTYRTWTGYENKVSRWMDEVNGYLISVQEYLDELNRVKKVWELTYEKERKNQETPRQLSERIREVVKETEQLQVEFVRFRMQLVLLEDKISDLLSYSDEVIGQVSQLQQHLRDSLFVSNEPYLWDANYSISEATPVLPRLKKVWYENAKTVRNFSHERSYFWPILIAVLIALLFFLIRRAYRKLGLSESDPKYTTVKRILFDHPYSSLAALLLFTFILVFPTTPLVLIGLLGTLILICVLVFFPSLVGPQGKVIVVMVLVLYIFNYGEIVAWYFGDYARIYIFLEALTGLYLTYKFGLKGFHRPSKKSAPFIQNVWLLSVVLFVIFAFAQLSNLFGFMNMAVLLLKTGVKLAAIVVIVFGAHAILRAVILASFEVGRRHDFAIMKGKWDYYEKRSIRLIDILAFVFALKFILESMELYRPLMDWLSEFLFHNWEIGTFQLSIGGVFSLILVLLATFVIANLVNALVDKGILVYTRLPKGVPEAILVTIRYFIVTLGVLMALGVAGIDMGKFGLLAGALGVGIGFGLQNIVNNFISGLILVYERPVNVGDTIEVENLMGTVKRVGIRSSNVRTYDGAEVVVPNGNLISNQLINWTLSDNKRRIELKVGTSYGSDPNLVLELLKKVAMDHDRVLKEPEPRALFEEFGDSSLNFRLLFWVPFEEGISTKSDIAIGVYNIFAENGIEIPFPQLDLHVKKDKDEETSKEQKDGEKT